MYSLALNEIASAIDTESLNDNDLCRILTFRAFQVFGASATYFATVDNEGIVHTRGSFGLTEELMESWHLYPLHLQLPSTDAIRLKKTIWELSLPDWSERYKDLNRFKLTSTAKTFVSWPIMRDRAPIGSMGFYSDNLLVPDKEIEQFFDTVGRLVSLHLRFTETRVLSDSLSFDSGIDNFESLTHRQRAILGLIADRKTNLQIAKELAYSPDTIRLDTIKIYKACGVTNRLEASELFMRTRTQRPEIFEVNDLTRAKRL